MRRKKKKSHYSALQKQPGHYGLLTWCYFCKKAQINNPLYIYNIALTTARIINFGIRALSLTKATEYLLGKSQSKLLQDVSRAQSFFSSYFQYLHVAITETEINKVKQVHVLKYLTYIQNVLYSQFQATLSSAMQITTSNLMHL